MYSLRSQKSYLIYQSYETVETADKCKRRKRIIHQKICTDVCLSDYAATAFDNTKSKLCSSIVGISIPRSQPDSKSSLEIDCSSYYTPINSTMWTIAS